MYLTIVKMTYSIKYIILPLWLVFVTFGFGLLNKKTQNRDKRTLSIQKIQRVLILGNSITYHKANPSIGWGGNWGMAASREEKDFVHLLGAKMREKQPNIEITVGNIANTFERKFWKTDTADFTNYRKSTPDLIILKIGENINDSLSITKSLDIHVEKLVNYVGHRNVRVCVVGSFWPKPHVNQVLEKLCTQNQWLYVSLGGLFENRKQNTAVDLYSDPGVGKHPSDIGMLAISDRIWNKIQFLF